MIEEKNLETFDIEHIKRIVSFRISGLFFINSIPNRKINHIIVWEWCIYSDKLNLDSLIDTRVKIVHKVL